MKPVDALPLLEVSGVEKSYGQRKALAGVSLAIAAGEFVALLGPNGAGKSTLFQLLSGLFIADAGSIRICGHDIRRAPVRALAKIGIVFQQATLDLDLSVERNLMFHARLHGLGGIEARHRIDRELEAQGLTERRGDRVRALSGGNRRKVELARAMVHDPSVLLMDEATVGLDPGSRAALLAQVHALCSDRGVGVLWASHLVDEAVDAARVVLLHKGLVRAEGPPDALTAAAGCRTLAEAFSHFTAGAGAEPAMVEQ